MESAVSEREEVIACLHSEQEYANWVDELAGGVCAAVEEIGELPDGYAFRFPGDGCHLEPLLETTAAERRYCPFLAFELAFESNGGAP